jgi:hypothetical protein
MNYLALFAAIMFLTSSVNATANTQKKKTHQRKIMSMICDGETLDIENNPAVVTDFKKGILAFGADTSGKCREFDFFLVRSTVSTLNQVTKIGGKKTTSTIEIRNINPSLYLGFKNSCGDYLLDPDIKTPFFKSAQIENNTITIGDSSWDWFKTGNEISCKELVIEIE